MGPFIPLSAAFQVVAPAALADALDAAHVTPLAVTGPRMRQERSELPEVIAPRDRGSRLELNPRRRGPWWGSRTPSQEPQRDGDGGRSPIPPSFVFRGAPQPQEPTPYGARFQSVIPMPPYRNLPGPPVDPFYGIPDYNGDGKVNSGDQLYLARRRLNLGRLRPSDGR